MNPFASGPGRALALARAAGWRLPLALVAATLAFALPLWLALIGAALAPAVQRLASGAEATVFAAPGAGSGELRALQAQLAAVPGVAAVQSLPRDAALAELGRRAALAGTVADLKSNPLPDAFAVRFGSPTEAAAAVDAIRKLPRVDAVQFNDGWIGTLAAARRVAQVVGAAAAGLLALAVALLLGHAVRAVVRGDPVESRLLELLGAPPGLAVAGGAWLGAALLTAAALLAVGIGEVLRAGSAPALRELAAATGSDIALASLPPVALAATVVAAAVLGALLGAFSARDENR